MGFIDTSTGVFTVSNENLGEMTEQPEVSGGWFTYLLPDWEIQKQMQERQKVVETMWEIIEIEVSKFCGEDWFVSMSKLILNWAEFEEVDTNF